MSLDVYEHHLADRPQLLSVVFEDGRSLPVPIGRWLGVADDVDLSLLERAQGPVLDVGCGPGRITAALAGQGVDALGVDISSLAVGMCERAGGAAWHGSVFAPVPQEGLWGTVVLADGNIGIGGDPARLLRRCRELLRPGGSVLVELDPDDRHDGAQQRLRLADGSGYRGDWFPWCRVGVSALGDLALQAGLRLLTSWTALDACGEPRSFAELVTR